MELNYRFWQKVNIGGADECWLWKAAIRGIPPYGCFSIKHKTYRAHRIAYELTHGSIEKGMCVCHTCDNPLCVNPSHLFLGTVGDNTRDMYAKGRGHHNHRRGEESPVAKLTEIDVGKIRVMHKAGMSFRKIGKTLGFSKSTVQAVVYGITWKHVN